MPTTFSSRGTYLVGSHYVRRRLLVQRRGRGPGQRRTVVLAETGCGRLRWTWHLDDDESTFVISRNTSRPVSPATSNALQHCSLALACTDVQPQSRCGTRAGSPSRATVVPR